jgi:hypothetical protein
MKRKIFIAIAILFAAFIAYAGYQFATTRSHSPAATVNGEHDGLAVSVKYCQPYKKGRLIFGEEKDEALVPYGKYWRLGSNESTEISFNKDVTFAGQPVKSGTYRMYAIPTADSWQVVLNSELGKWGYSEPDYKLDVVKVSVPVQKATEEKEQFTIDLSNQASGLNLDLLWDNTKVTVPIAGQ